MEGLFVAKTPMISLHQTGHQKMEMDILKITGIKTLNTVLE